MPDERPRVVHGGVTYRELSAGELALIQEGHELANQVGLFIDKLRSLHELDQRFVSIGVTQLQLGFLALQRAVARPGHF